MSCLPSECTTLEPSLWNLAQGGDLRAVARRVLALYPQLQKPGGGQTLERWRVLAAIAGADVCLAKVLEAHYDAQAILAELGQPAPGCR